MPIGPGLQYNSGIAARAGSAEDSPDGSRTIDANRILTDLLVNFRRIVHRGLINYSGELWYREGLPSDVFRRLVIRKENETPLDRFSGDYEELITYASFRDLADIIAGNEALRERLSILEPRDGASLLDRLHELEEMRRSITLKSPEGPEDGERLRRYYDDFRHAIKGGRRGEGDRSGRAQPVKPLASGGPPTAEGVEEETLDSIFEPEEPPPPPPKRSGRLVVKVSADDLRGAGDEAPGTPVTRVATTPGPPKATGNEAVGAVETPITQVSVRPGPGTSTPTGPIDRIETVERAILDGDHGVVLKALHLEVTTIADGMLRRDPEHGHPVWELVNRVGWMDEHAEAFGLQPLEIFFTLADTYLEAYDEDARASDLKEMLAQASFSKLLLTLREMFLGSRAKV